MEGGTRVRRTVIWGAVVAVLAALLFSTTALAGVGQGASGSDVAAQQTSPTAVVTQVATVVITQTPVPAATNEGGFPWWVFLLPLLLLIPLIFWLLNRRSKDNFVVERTTETTTRPTTTTTTRPTTTETTRPTDTTTRTTATSDSMSDRDNTNDRNTRPRS